MFLYRRPLARFRWQEAEPAIYLQPYIPDDLGELAASEMPGWGIDSRGVASGALAEIRLNRVSSDRRGNEMTARSHEAPRKQRRFEETALGARPAPPEEVAEEIAPTEVDPASSPASVPSSSASAPRAAVVPLHAPAATPGVSASASAEADSDDEALPLAKNWRNKRYRAKRRAEFLRAVNHRESRLRWLAGSNEYQRQSKRAYRACQLLDGLRALRRGG